MQTRHINIYAYTNVYIYQYTHMQFVAGVLATDEQPLQMAAFNSISIEFNYYGNH